MKRKASASPGRGGEFLARLRGVSTPAATRATHIGLWALVGLTFFAAAVALLRPPPKASAAAKVPESTVGAQGFAELYVAAYLGAGKGTEESLRPFYPDGVDLRDVTPASVYPGRTTAIEAREVDRHYWAVTVGVEVLYPQGAGLQSGGVRFYQVGVVRQGETYVATALPAEVPAPAAGRRPKLVIGSLDRPERNDPVAAAVAHFAAAFLTGNGELARYTAPGSTLRPVRPAPFTSVEVTGLSERDVERKAGDAPVKAKEVLAELEGTEASGRVQVLQYALELTQRAGRWEVSKLLPGPSLAPEQPRASTSSTQPPDSSTTAPSTTTTAVATTTTTTATSTVNGRAPSLTPERTTPIR
jgi:hypothetical protein